MTVYATLSDVEALWPLSAGATTTRATALLRNAHALLNSRLPGLAANVADATIDADLALMVVVDAVVRVLANPAGVSSQTVGPEAATYTGVRTLGTVAFTDAELAVLSPSGGSVGGMAIGSVGLGVPGWLERERYAGMADATFVRPLVPDPQLLYVDDASRPEGF
jgi:hypothetical protein